MNQSLSPGLAAACAWLLLACSSGNGAFDGGASGAPAVARDGATDLPAGDAGALASGGGGGASGNPGSSGRGGAGSSGSDGGTGRQDAGAKDASADAGGAGADAPAPNMRCEPGTTDDDLITDVTSCYNWDDTHTGIPNLSTASLKNLRLPAPTIAGQRYAMSLDMDQVAGDATIELWGASGPCGDPVELLWWAPLVVGELCAEFVPSQAYTDLIMVWRVQRSEQGVTHLRSVTHCPAGSCGAGRFGVGLGVDPGPLDPPPGYFEASGSYDSPLRFDLRVGTGRMWLAGHAPIRDVGDTAAVEHGYFRMSADQPFSDAWYCSGAGSTITKLADNVYGFDLDDVTELGRCPAASGSNTVTLTTATRVNTLSSTLPELQSALSDSSGCGGVSIFGTCSRLLVFSAGGARLRFHAYGDAQGRMEGANRVYDLTDAALVLEPAPGAYDPPAIACAGQGTLSVAPDGSETLSLQAVSAFASCPGTSAARTTFSGILE